ncbi:acyl-CoA N-acyltransferase [Cystobasidium minutum MCA 4210]|uniref:acyl-CoA N-acyltransferase n=1 Tax=Cystobasidium minutum MCA 4210 TaxID=1397322 RepID=UPI0034CE2B9E|eukprot:jgi/Rhomi1/165166/fgenesh1_kg.1_\
MAKSLLLEAAGNATSEELCTKLYKEDHLRKFLTNHAPTTLQGHTISLKLTDNRSATLFVVKASELTDQAKEDVVQLFEENMKAIYTASKNGYSPEDKCEELFNEETRFILVYEAATPDLLAFTSFRFDREDTADDDTQVEVVYCYEVQVSQKARGTGLGRLLMRSLETFARAYGLPKVMLTVFEANIQARTFYKRVNYESDEICPSNYEYDTDDEKPDYLILSRSVRSRSSRNNKKKKPAK